MTQKIRKDAKSDAKKGNRPYRQGPPLLIWIGRS